MIAKFTQWLQNLYQPEEMQCREMALEDIHSALNDPTIRKYWMTLMMERIKDINLEVDNLLGKEDKTRIWETFAIERRTLLASLRMILDAKNLLESEREEQERQNRVFDSYRGAAASLPLDNRVDNRASDPQRS